MKKIFLRIEQPLTKEVALTYALAVVRAGKIMKTEFLNLQNIDCMADGGILG